MQCFIQWRHDLIHWLFVVTIGCVCFVPAEVSTLERSPFYYELKPKDIWSVDDWIHFQGDLRKMDIIPFLKEKYADDEDQTPFSDYQMRCTAGLNQTFIDLERGCFPTTTLEKIGKGGDLCVVSYASYDKYYPEFIESNGVALEALGFNGYYLYSLGEFPNPTGRERRLASVPYTFKIGMMLEAQKLGFTKVLWIDAAILPVRNPTPLFDWLDKTGAFLFEDEVFPSQWRYILPATHQLLMDLTGTDVLKTRHIWGGIFGLKMDSPEAILFIETFYRFAELGLPFISCFPEQFVYTAIAGQQEYKKWLKFPGERILFEYNDIDSLVYVQKAKILEYYFYLRRNRHD